MHPIEQTQLYEIKNRDRIDLYSWRSCISWVKILRFLCPSILFEREALHILNTLCSRLSLSVSLRRLERLGAEIQQRDRESPPPMISLCRYDTILYCTIWCDMITLQKQYCRSFVFEFVVQIECLRHQCFIDTSDLLEHSYFTIWHKTVYLRSFIAGHDIWLTGWVENSKTDCMSNWLTPWQTEK